MIFIKALVALFIRLYLGWSLLNSGIVKWKAGFSGTAVTGYLKGALGKTHSGLLASKGPQAAAHPDVTDTWAWMINHLFLPNAEVFAFLVKTGEVLIGLALILGLLTHVAAAFGIMLNFVFLLSGSASITGPMILGLSVLFLFGSASYLIGLDRFFMKNFVKSRPTLRSDWLKPFFPVETSK